VRVERKFDWNFTRSFKRQLASLSLNEFEQQIIFATIGNFCTSIDKNTFNPVEIDGKLYFEITVNLFTRSLIISFEVEGIDAVAYKIERI